MAGLDTQGRSPTFNWPWPGVMPSHSPACSRQAEAAAAPLGCPLPEATLRNRRFVRARALDGPQLMRGFVSRSTRMHEQQSRSDRKSAEVGGEPRV